MNHDPDDIFTRADIEPATQALLARLPKAGETCGQYDTDTTSTAHVYTERTTPQTLDCEGIPSEVVNASALLDRVCEVLGVPLVDLLRTVEAMPRWVPAKDVPVGTMVLRAAIEPNTDNGALRLDEDTRARWISVGGFILIDGLYPPPPGVTR